MQEKRLFTVSDAPQGVYIFTENKSCIVPKFWGMYEEKEKPVGAIIVSDRKLIVAINGSEESISLLDYSTEQTNKKYETVEEAIKDINGAENTKFLADLGSEAAKFCLDYSCGNIVKGEWYLPALGELQLMYNHKKELDIALAICGGNAIETDDWHWSSTRRYDKSNWVLFWINGNRNLSNQINVGRVRPVSAFL